MKLIDRVLLILFIGSIWGFAELFGWDMLRSMKVAHPSIMLFVVSFFILFAAKMLLKFPGALIPIAMIAVLYKTLGVQFFKCQTTAVLLIAAFVDLAYHVIKSERYKSWKVRAAVAPVITFCSFLLFGLYREFIYAAPGFDIKGFEGALNYMIYSGIPAMLLSTVIVHPSWAFGKYLQENGLALFRAPAFKWTYSVGASLMALIWVLLFLY